MREEKEQWIESVGEDYVDMPDEWQTQREREHTQRLPVIWHVEVVRHNMFDAWSVLLAHTR